MKKIKNLIKFGLPVLVATLICGSLIWAANSFPTSLNSWSSGDTIEASWANALESKIGADSSSVTSSHDYLLRYLPSQDGDWSFGSNDFTMTGTTSFATLNTGQGNYELYAMSQDVESTDDVTFADLTLSGTSSFTGALTMGANIVMADNSIIGIDTLTFTDTAGTIAGIANGDLLSKSDNETITEDWTFQGIARGFRLDFKNYSTSIYEYGGIRFYKSHQAGVGFTETLNNEYLGGMEVYGVDSGPSLSGYEARIEFVQDGAAGATYIPVRISFLTGTNAAAPTEQMIIDSAGNVSIGKETSATGDLDIYDTASTTVYIGDVTHSGCLVMGDTDGGGLTYITVLNGVMSATDTKPEICK